MYDALISLTAIAALFTVAETTAVWLRHAAAQRREERRYRAWVINNRRHTAP